MEVPGDFQFSLKLSKEVTHAKDLNSDIAWMNKFMKTASGIGNKKGCLLIQFPGKITLDHYEKIELILQELQGHDRENQWRKAIEFRHPSWYIGETYELLDEFDATLVLHDIPKAKIELPTKTGFVYMRFHGPKGDYRGGYTDSFLSQKATQITEWSKEGRDVYVYFNNTIGSAYENAITLKSILNC